MATEIYRSILLRLIEFTVPVAIAGPALRCRFRSEGFNRVYYIYVAGHCALAFALLGLIAMMVRVAAWSCLPLWAFVLNEVRQLPGGRYGTDAPEARTESGRPTEPHIT